MLTSSELQLRCQESFLFALPHEAATEAKSAALYPFLAGVLHAPFFWLEADLQLFNFFKDWLWTPRDAQSSCIQRLLKSCFGVFFCHDTVQIRRNFNYNQTETL